MVFKQLPKVTYIVPVYNHQQYVTQTLDSILHDTYTNKELIIIDDGSTDNSHAIIQQWILSQQNQLDIVYKSRKNQGISKTLNELISLSSGKYIIPIASDDYLINDMTLKRVELLEMNPHKLMLINDAIVIDENNNKTFNSGNFELYHGCKNNFYNDKKLLFEIANNWSCVGPICILNKEIYEEIGYYNPNLLIEDWDFYLRAATKQRIIFENWVVAAYRKHSYNTHSSLNKKFLMLNSLKAIALENSKNVPFPINLILYYKFIKLNLSLLKLHFITLHQKIIQRYKC